MSSNIMWIQIIDSQGFGRSPGICSNGDAMFEVATIFYASIAIGSATWSWCAGAFKKRAR
jgi:hypothetical protein